MNLKLISIILLSIILSTSCSLYDNKENSKTICEEYSEAKKINIEYPNKIYKINNIEITEEQLIKNCLNS
jgi:hypothetical protein